MPTDAISYQVSDEPSQAMVRVVDEGLDQANFSVPPLSDVRPLAVFAIGTQGQVVGGAVGRTWGSCCELQQLWVEQGLRRSGLGTNLLQQFEAHALTRHCKVFYLTTFSFQAPDFYRRHGYTMQASIAGFPDGIVKHLMQKSGA